MSLHLQNMSQKLNSGDPEFLLTKEKNALQLKRHRYVTQTHNYNATTLSLKKPKTSKRPINRVADLNHTLSVSGIVCFSYIWSRFVYKNQI